MSLHIFYCNIYYCVEFSLSYEDMQRCWKEVKEERPTFTELKMKLKATRLALKRKQRDSRLENLEEENYINDDMNPNNDQ